MSYIEKFWRDATVSDLVKVMESETVEARFADDGGSWVSSRLRGWRSSSRVLDNWIDDDGARWDCCQVYDPPQWFLDKPEPGEGYRLLSKNPDEALLPGDEAFRLNGKWALSSNGNLSGHQMEGIWYRRKIEQPKPKPKFTVGQRVRIVGPVCGEGPIYNWTKEMDQYIGAVGTVRLKPTQDPEGTFYAVGEIVGWSFREDYLEPAEPKHHTLRVGDTISTPSGRQAIVTEHGVEVS